MNEFEYYEVMKYFPPVNPDIPNIYCEANYSYQFFNSKLPLKNVNNDELYSEYIMFSLQQLRLLLNSNISKERFLYEINKLLTNWGDNGYYNMNILNSNLVNLINTINSKENNLDNSYSSYKHTSDDNSINSIINKISDIKINSKVKNKSSIHKHKDIKKNITFKNLKII